MILEWRGDGTYYCSGEQAHHPGRDGQHCRLQGRRSRQQADASRGARRRDHDRGRPAIRHAADLPVGDRAPGVHLDVGHRHRRPADPYRACRPGRRRRSAGRGADHRQQPGEAGARAGRRPALGDGSGSALPGRRRSGDGWRHVRAPRHPGQSRGAARARRDRDRTGPRALCVRAGGPGSSARNAGAAGPYPARAGARRAAGEPEGRDHGGRHARAHRPGALHHQPVERQARVRAGPGRAGRGRLRHADQRHARTRGAGGRRVGAGRERRGHAGRGHDLRARC